MREFKEYEFMISLVKFQVWCRWTINGPRWFIKVDGAETEQEYTNPEVALVALWQAAEYYFKVEQSITDGSDDDYAYKDQDEGYF